MSVLYFMSGALMAGATVAAVTLPAPDALWFVLIGIGLGCVAVFNDARGFRR